MRWLCLFVLLSLCPLALFADRSFAQSTETANGEADDASFPTWEKKLFKQFQQKVYGAIQDEQVGCVECHISEGTSALVLSGQPLEDFRLLLDDRYLERDGPDTLLGRITSDHPERRMPKDADPWSPKQIKQLRRLVRAIEKQQQDSGQRSDEQFPRSLLSNYHQTTPAARNNQFISYRQLIGKIQVIFEDDWVRGDRNLFAENVAMFGGADFETRFNEATEPSASYLTGLEMLARDVSSRAYQQRSGPFENWLQPESDPRQLDEIDEPHRRAIAQLYQRVLYRSPSDEELVQALELLRGVMRLDGEIATRDSRLVFELTVTDPESGQAASRTIEIPVRGDRLEVRQLVIDQRTTVDRDSKSDVSADSQDPAVAKILAAPSDGNLQRTVLGGPVHLKPQEPEQRLAIYNEGTYRNVSFAGVEIANADGDIITTVNVDSPAVQVDGAWELKSDGGVKSFEDGNHHKGLSSITVPLAVDEEADYYVTMLWRANTKNTPHALVELFADGAGNQLQAPAPAEKPKTGAAHFFYDCSNDTEPYFALNGAFQFDADSYVEISNAGTLAQVTAGGIEFLEADEPANSFLIDSQNAVGSEAWSRFDEGRFNAYNVKGKKLHDENKNKGELSLRYLPSSKATDEKSPDWQADKYYQLHVYYPGKRDQETRVPVTVVAKRSSPIVQITHPVFAKADARLRLDASASYTLQGSPLQFRWKQVSGPTLELGDSHSAALEFHVPRQNARQFAWSALCAALMRHPDFLFTRAPSLASANAEDQQQLRLAKLALDLVGRPPTEEEIQCLADGQSLITQIDRYLDSEEFRDFYFHRIRLYLESQGTTVQDEPARLWSYIAFNNLPFKQILTADYTVDADFKRVKRPDYHGRTGVLTTEGFIQGKPGLPHYNYSAQVSMLFLGYVYEVPPEIVEQREGVTALGTTDPISNCYSCHKILTPLAFQRLNWTDDGKFRTQDEDGLDIDASDRGAVADYPFSGAGLEAFATQAANKERFIRTIINTHVNFYFGRPMRHRTDERELYKRLWDDVHDNNFKIRDLIRAIVTSEEYLRVDDEPLMHASANN